MMVRTMELAVKLDVSQEMQLAGIVLQVEVSLYPNVQRSVEMDFWLELKSAMMEVITLKDAILDA